MFERFKRDSDRTAGDREPRTANGRTAVAERPADTRTSAMDREPAHTRTRDEQALREEQATRRHTTTRGSTAGPATGPAVGTREHMHEARARQREEYGGVNWGAAFFGWLVAVGLGSLLAAILTAAGAAIGLTEVTGTEAEQNAESIGLGGAIALIGRRRGL